MFATSSRSRRAGQPSVPRGAVQETADPPLEGADSCFGVISLANSVEWVGERESGEEGAAEEAAPSSNGKDLAEREDEARGEENDGRAEAVIADDALLADSTLPAQSSSPTPPAPLSPSLDDAPATIRQSTLPAPLRVPSPALFLPILSTSAAPSASHTPPATVDSPPAVSDYSTDTDTDDENHSAPPSPTSLNSLPSYLASEMSMSMPSSPGMGYSTDPGSESGIGSRRGGGVGAVLQALERERARSGVGAHSGGRREGEDAPDLVIPMLSLPSSSLHLSLRRFEGPVEGLKIALVGDVGDTKAFLRALGEKEELVEIGRNKGGGVGLVRGGKLEVVLLTGLSVSQIRQKVVASYTALHGLLNPSAAKGDQSKLRDMVARYADREDWVHGCLSVGDVYDTGIDVAALEGLVYSLPRPDPSTFAAHETPISASSPLSPATHMDDPTPLARVESSSYFAHPLTERTPIPSIPELPIIISPTASTIHALQTALDSPIIRETSIDNFLAWRPAPLDSSQSSIDTQSAGTGTSGTLGMDKEVQVHLMPTVARAQGGGEWEAGLSRRVAKRRETDGGGPGSASTSQHRVGGAAADRGGRRRRSTKGSSGLKGLAAASPLFPPTSASRREKDGDMVSEPYGPGLGVKSLLEKTFAPLRGGLQGWKRALVVAAIVGVVGWGWWISGRQVWA